MSRVCLLLKLMSIAYVSSAWPYSWRFQEHRGSLINCHHSVIMLKLCADYETRASWISAYGRNKVHIRQLQRFYRIFLNVSSAVALWLFCFTGNLISTSYRCRILINGNYMCWWDFDWRLRCLFNRKPLIRTVSWYRQLQPYNLTLSPSCKRRNLIVASDGVWLLLWLETREYYQTAVRSTSSVPAATRRNQVQRCCKLSSRLSAEERYVTWVVDLSQHTTAHSRRFQSTASSSSLSSRTVTLLILDATRTSCCVARRLDINRPIVWQFVKRSMPKHKWRLQQNFCWCPRPRPVLVFPKIKIQGHWAAHTIDTKVTQIARWRKPLGLVTSMALASGQAGRAPAAVLCQLSKTCWLLQPLRVSQNECFLCMDCWLQDRTT